MVKFSLVGKVVDFPLGHNFNVRFRHNSDQKVEQDNLHQQLVHYHQDPDTADHCWWKLVGLFKILSPMFEDWMGNITNRVPEYVDQVINLSTIKSIPLVLFDLIFFKFRICLRNFRQLII